MVLVYMQNAFIMEDVSVKLNKAIAAFTPIFFTWNCQFLIEIFLPYLCVFCDDGDDTQSKEENSCDAYIDNDPDDDQGDKEEQVYEAGNDDDHNDDDDASDNNPHDHNQGDTEERVYEGGKLHGTATFTSHTGDREERLSPQL